VVLLLVLLLHAGAAAGWSCCSAPGLLMDVLLLLLLLLLGVLLLLPVLLVLMAEGLAKEDHFAWTSHAITHTTKPQLRVYHALLSGGHRCCCARSKLPQGTKGCC
jgi:hypothetical protein